jgi:hypothetical protein
MPPYAEDHAPASIPAPIIPLEKIGIDRWQHDVWYRIVEAALHGHPDQCNLVDLPGFDRPAASRYGATTPALLRWYDAWNEGKAYKDQVRPFNFLTAFQATQALPDEPDDQPATLTKRRGKRSDLPRPVAPFDANPGRAAQQCFDRVMGTPIPAGQLKTYAQVFAQYHLHPEAKFRNGDYLDHGLTERRHVVATGVRYIGKEANRWEEQFYLGYDPETQIEYGTDEESIAAIRARICEAARAHGQRRLAETASVPRERLRLFIAGRAKLRAKTVARLLGATRFLDEGNRARS